MSNLNDLECVYKNDNLFCDFWNNGEYLRRMAKRVTTNDDKEYEIYKVTSTNGRNYSVSKKIGNVKGIQNSGADWYVKHENINEELQNKSNISKWPGLPKSTVPTVPVVENKISSQGFDWSDSKIKKGLIIYNDSEFNNFVDNLIDILHKKFPGSNWIKEYIQRDNHNKVDFDKINKENNIDMVISLVRLPSGRILEADMVTAAKMATKKIGNGKRLIMLVEPNAYPDPADISYEKYITRLDEYSNHGPNNLDDRVHVKDFPIIIAHAYNDNNFINHFLTNNINNQAIENIKKLSKGIIPNESKLFQIIN